MLLFESTVTTSDRAAKTASLDSEAEVEGAKREREEREKVIRGERREVRKKR